MAIYVEEKSSRGTIASVASNIVCNPCNPWSKQANIPEAARAQRRAKTSLSSR